MLKGIPAVKAAFAVISGRNVLDQDASLERILINRHHSVFDRSPSSDFQPALL